MALPARERAAQRKLVSQMFSYLRQSAEVRHYLKHFGSADAERFAVIKVTGDLLHLPEEAERVASALVFLHRVGLIPVVIHGAGLFSGNRTAEVEAALRSVTEEDAARIALQKARAYMERANDALCLAIRTLGVGAAPMLDGCFQATSDPRQIGPGRGIVGKIQGVRADEIRGAVASGSIPVVAALATPRDTAASLTFSTWAAAEALATELKPLKVVVLRPEGGFLSRDGSRLSRVSLAREFDSLCPPPQAQDDESEAPLTMSEAASGIAASQDSSASSAPETLQHASASASASASTKPAGVIRVHNLQEDDDSMHFGPISTPSTVSNLLPTQDRHPKAYARSLSPSDQEVLRRVAHLFDAASLEPGSTVAVTSPVHLAAELFTDRGSGTLVVRGEPVRKLASLDQIDTARLAELLEEAFGKPLPADYLDTVRPKLRAVYASDTLRGAAIVTNEGGFAYLDKFAVSPTAQGDKLGDDVWQALVSGEPELVWRSRSDNRVNPWYFARSHGSYASHASDPDMFPGRDGDAAASTGDWTVFWRGVGDSRILEAVRAALVVPKTFR